MGISTRQITFVGKVFKDSDKALGYLLSKNIITQDEFDNYKNEAEEFGENLEDIVTIDHIPNFPKFSMVDYCLGDNPMLMYEIETNVRNGTNPQKYENDVANAKENWKNIFDDDVDVDTVTQYS